MKWFTVNWWRYVLDDSRADHDYGPFEDVIRWQWLENWRGDYTVNWIARAGNQLARCVCRAKGHPAGVFFYNVGGCEPDMTCRGCGEDLG